VHLCQVPGPELSVVLAAELREERSLKEQALEGRGEHLQRWRRFRSMTSANIRRPATSS